MKRIAIYPGTFDPITHGHMDIVKRAACIFDKLIIAIACDTVKNTLFSFEERVQMAQEAIKDLEHKNIEVTFFHGLLMDFAIQKGAHIIVRGLRAVSDFEYEFQMSYINHKLQPNVETIFLPATENGHFISSSFVKEIARLGGNLNGMVPNHVATMLTRHYHK